MMMRAAIWTLVLAACKGEPQPVAQQVVVSDARVAAHVRLPKVSGAIVRRTSKPLTAEELGRLALIEHDDFERQDHGATSTAIKFRHVTRTRPRLGVTVEIGACGPCVAIDISDKRREAIRAELPEALRGRADTTVELATKQVAGVTAAASYKLGAAFGSDAHGQPTGDYIDAYELAYNDGSNWIRVTASYLDDAVGGVAAMRAIAPREDLEKLAAAFFGFYAQTWQ